MLNKVQHAGTVSYKRFTTTEELGGLVENDLALLLAESYEVAAGTATGRETELLQGPVTNLLYPRNPLLGRDIELATACNWLLQPNAGVVTVTGPAGVGKSRLALEVALQVRDQFPDGAFLVRLTPVAEPERVMPTISETLGLRDVAQGVSRDDALTKFLRNKRMLLLLDNFEQVLAAAPRLAFLTETCPTIKLLVTSRTSLHLRGEKELLLAPLPTPGAEAARVCERLEAFASIELLVQRTRSVRADFAVAPDNCEAIAQIVRRLDGLPLALELAAARLRLLTPHQLLERLDDRFEILSGGARDLPERQHTLRGAIDWSYNLLSEPAKALFRRLAVFAGGWSIKAAEAVCNPSNDLGASVLDELESLIDCTLVSVSEGVGGRPRFGMLQSIREYALERLLESGELHEMNKLHIQHYLGFVQEVEPRVRSAERLHWQAILQAELDNIRAAMNWALRCPEDLALGQQLAVTLVYFWVFCGFAAEGRQWCERFLASVDEDTAPAIRAGLLGLAGGIALVSSGDDAVVPGMLESVEQARQSGDRKLLANCLLCTGAWALSMKSLSLAWRYLHESLGLFEDLNDPWSQVLALNWISYVAFQRGDRPAAEEISKRCLELAREQGDPWLMTVPLLSLAQRALPTGAYSKARAAVLEVLPIIRSVGAQWHLAWAVNALGQIHLEQGELEQARGHFAEALKLAREHANAFVMSLSLLEAATLLTCEAKTAAHGDDRGRALDRDTAGRLCGVTVQLTADPAVFRRLGSAEVHEAMLTRVRSCLTTDEWDCAYSEGTRMSLEKALDYAASVFAGG
jgi:predicted ATPase